MKRATPAKRWVKNIWTFTKGHYLAFYFKVKKAHSEVNLGSHLGLWMMRQELNCSEALSPQSSAAHCL